MTVERSERAKYENLQDKQPAQEKNSWLSAADADEKWKKDSVGEEKKRKSKNKSLYSIQRDGRKLSSFSPIFRLKKRREFELFRDIPPYAGRFVVIKRFALSSVLKFGFVLSTKLGKATRRNRIRRILKEWCRLHKSEIPSGYYLIIVRRLPENKLTRHLWDDLNESFRKFLR